MIQRVTSWRLQESLKNLRTMKKTMPIVLANIVQNHFVEGFRLGGYRTDASKGGWKKRQFTAGKGKRGILIGKGSGLLRRDIKKRVTSFSRIVVGTSQLTQAYAEIQNEGGNITITPKMRRFFWYKFETVKNKAEKAYWKSLALHTGSTITIPKREYIGESRDLENKLISRIDKEIQKVFK